MALAKTKLTWNGDIRWPVVAVLPERRLQKIEHAIDLLIAQRADKI